MLHYVKKIVKVNDNYSIICLFNTGEQRVINLTEQVEQFRKANDGWASQIANLAYFKQVTLDSYGTLKWDNDLDFCPDVLYGISLPYHE
ncbi:MAG: DUF2442 domain-containing protein [Chitinophagia bacterium]|nr:DUF2442 domain-containing protein [Chitinophagia bacterium]